MQKLLQELAGREYFQVDVGKPTLVYYAYTLDPNWRRFESVKEFLFLEPLHFQKFPDSKNMTLNFIRNASPWI